MTGLLIFLAIAALGLTAGAVPAEAMVLVPYWRSLPAASFLAWYRQHGELLFRFYAPLEMVAFVLVVAAAGASWLDGGAGTTLLVVASTLSFVVLLSFPFYFQRVNASFAAATIAPGDVPGELARWARWHWVRVGLGTGSFLASIAAAAA
jgi:hypothetical protein